ncbi:ThiF family adenylyltransferase [Humibacter antri]
MKAVVPAIDGIDYIPGNRGHRRLLPEFVANNISACAEDGLAYLAVHNHGGTTTVGFSGTDMASHERGYPSLLDINRGVPVGALVFAREAVAGDIWTGDGKRHKLKHLRIVGRHQQTLTAEPLPESVADPSFDRQARIFGDRGQALLSGSRVAIVGLGGVGSLVCEYLARLGVGELILIDPDRIDPTNLPRVVGARRWEAMTALRRDSMPAWMQRLGEVVAARKVRVAARVARQASRRTRVSPIARSVMEPDVAALLTDCDHIFLAADSALARRLVNSLSHQYLIPFTQVGSKVSTADGTVVDIFSVVRMSTPGSGCLQCNGLISPAKLAEEATTEAQRKRQRYVDDSGVHAPSVITLNAVGAARAVDDWLMSLGGFVGTDVGDNHWVAYHPLADLALETDPGSHEDCLHCGPSRFAMGDAIALLAAPHKTVT